MKKFLIILFLLVGCAHAPVYNPPSDFVQRMNAIGTEVCTCIQPSQKLEYHIAISPPIGAWLDNNKIFFTEGLFKFDDDTLKFIMAHETSHDKLGHYTKINVINYVTTGLMMVVNTVIPGAGYLSHLINPTVIGAFSKEQELDADKLASETCLCLGIPIDKQVAIMESMRLSSSSGGKLWDMHPTWDDRIKNIKEP